MRNYHSTPGDSRGCVGTDSNDAGAAPPSRLGDTSHGFRRARLSIAACEVRGGTADISGECDAERAG